LALLFPYFRTNFHEPPSHVSWSIFPPCEKTISFLQWSPRISPDFGFLFCFRSLSTCVKLVYLRNSPWGVSTSSYENLGEVFSPCTTLSFVFVNTSIRDFRVTLRPLLPLHFVLASVGLAFAEPMSIALRHSSFSPPVVAG